MIIEIQIPDELYKAYGKDVKRLEKQLADTVNLDPDPKLRKFFFSTAQMTQLRAHFGPNIKDAAAIVNLIEQVGTIKLLKTAYKLDSDQITQLKTEAYFYANHDEPHEPGDNSYDKATHAVVINRHAQKVLNDAFDYILGLG